MNTKNTMGNQQPNSKESKECFEEMKDRFFINESLAINLVKRKSRVLSIGCGFGREVKYLVKELNCDVVAIDNNPEAIRSSKEIEPNAEYICTDALKYNKPNSFDYIVVIWNTINYLKKESRKELIKLCSNNLKKGGKLIITSAHIFHKWSYFLHNIKHMNKYYYFPNEIRYWFSQTEFKTHIIKIKGTNIILATSRK